MNKAQQILGSLKKLNESKMSDLTADLTEPGWYVFNTKGEVEAGPFAKKADIDSKYLDKDDSEFSVMEVGKDDLSEATKDTSHLIEKIYSFIGKEVFTGDRVTVKGYPIDIGDGAEDYLDITAIDKDAATGIMKELRRGGFKVTRNNDTELTIESLSTNESVKNTFSTKDDWETAMEKAGANSFKDDKDQDDEGNDVKINIAFKDMKKIGQWNYVTNRGTIEESKKSITARDVLNSVRKINESVSQLDKPAGDEDELSKKGALVGTDQGVDYSTGAGEIAEAIGDDVLLVKNKTYSVYYHDPRTNSYSYLLGYFDSRNDETVSQMKTRVAKGGEENVFIFDKTIDRKDTSAKAVNESSDQPKIASRVLESLKKLNEYN